VQLVLDDRTAEREAVLLDLQRRLLLAPALREDVLGDEVLVPVETEDLAVELVGAGFGHGRDDGR
jgi:hypothetical protein